MRSDSEADDRRDGMNKESQSQAWRAHDHETEELLFLEQLAKLARDKTPPAPTSDHGWKQLTNLVRPNIGNKSRSNPQ